MLDNLWENFRESAEKHAEKAAFRYVRDKKWLDVSYRSLERSACSLSALLAEKGLRFGDRVAVAVSNGPEWPLIFFGVMRSGGVSVPVSASAGIEEARGIVRDAGCAMLFSDREELLSLAAGSGVKVFSVKGPEFVAVMRGHSRGDGSDDGR
ncbi:MAG: AMP-binding protein, partial [Candidatus Omnitrophota bacterium]